MRNKIKRAIAIFIIVTGILFLIYPYYINKMTAKEIDNSINDFFESVGNEENDNTVFDNYQDERNYYENTNYEDNNFLPNNSMKTYSSTNNYKRRTSKKNKNSSDIEIYGNTIVEKTNQISDEILDYLYTKMNEYNLNLNKDGQSIVDAFSYENPSFDLTQYGLKENIIGIIYIPKINLELPIYLGATKENLNKGAVHLSQTSIPLGKIDSNSVIAAHRSLFRNPFFRNIDKLEIGDEVIIRTLWNTLTYKVTAMQVISPYDSSKILIQKNKNLVTLITCHPYGQTIERYIVYCEGENL